MYELIALILWVACLWGIDRLAKEKNYSSGPFLFFGIFFTIFVLVLLIFLPDREPPQQAKPTPRLTLPFACPQCAKKVQPEASECQACGHFITEEERAAGMQAAMPKSRVHKTT